jgi:hypothetical protein
VLDVGLGARVEAAAQRVRQVHVGAGQTVVVQEDGSLK